jgi:hypothetical protein
LGWRALIAVFRRGQTPACTAVNLHVAVGVILTARRRIAVVRHERLVDAMTQGRARQTTRERKMDTTTLLVIVLVVLLVGGGGYFYKRRV